MGDVKPWSMGEKPMCYPCFDLPSSLSCSISLLFCEVVEGSYCMRRRGHGEASVWQVDLMLEATSTRPYSPFSPLRILSMVCPFLIGVCSSARLGHCLFASRREACCSSSSRLGFLFCASHAPVAGPLWLCMQQAGRTASRA